MCLSRKRPGSHQRGIAQEDAEGCHTDQRCAPTRRETHEVLSTRPDFCHISDAPHTSAGEVKRSLATDSRSVSLSPRSIRAHRRQPRAACVPYQEQSCGRASSIEKKLTVHESNDSSTSREIQPQDSHPQSVRKHRLYIEAWRLVCARGSAEPILLQWNRRTDV